ncbi:hypothetical protein BJX61DRAFT_531516 [Aspergillus egyptiacus]|nr:hypothetical protein BJX61DRAFT_531516 [Aspergillus egyptiacus]
MLDVLNILPDAVHHHKYDLQQKQGEFIILGPNFIWSVDGYFKLELVLRQYLETIDDVQLLPSRIRSDQGSEIVLFRSAHLQLCRVREPNIQLNSCWISGRSTENQRIEAWWEQLSKGALYKWRSYFMSLSEDGLFSKASLADQIALYAIYTPILRTEVCHFVQAWNCHRIRRQPNRPNSIGGKPYMLYHYPENGVQDYGHPVDNPTLQQLKRDIQEFDPDEYLPQPTLQFCRTALQGLQFDPDNPPPIQPADEAVPFRTTYLQLLHILITHIERQIQPFLALSTRPIGAFHWEPEVA